MERRVERREKREERGERREQERAGEAEEGSRENSGEESVRVTGTQYPAAFAHLFRVLFERFQSNFGQHCTIDVGLHCAKTMVKYCSTAAGGVIPSLTGRRWPAAQEQPSS